MQEKKDESTYTTDEWGCEAPAEFPEAHWIVANHLFDAVVESVDSECPWNGYAFEKDEEEQAETADRIRVQNLEDIHSALLRTHVQSREINQFPSERKLRFFCEFHCLQQYAYLRNTR